MSTHNGAIGLKILPGVKMPDELLHKLRAFDTCTVSNAVERLNYRMRNDGSISGRALRCLFPELPPVVGYAVTGRMRSTMTPVKGRAYHENMSWWRYVESLPEPRIMVVEDVDERPGAGALVGELHAVIGMALRCVGYVTNGAVRDLPAVEALGFQMFAGNVAVSHMYAHISEFGTPVEIGGQKISPGDLIHGDRHGVHIIPPAAVAEIPAMASEILQQEDELKSYCRSAQFSLKGLEQRLGQIPGDGLETMLDGAEWQPDEP